jgi:zinc and cadmium transporter
VTPLGGILGGGILMVGITLLGAVTFLLGQTKRERVILPLVAFSAGSLLGGAFFHMIPEASAGQANPLQVSIWVLTGFSVFFVFEQVLHWHHCQQSPSRPQDTLPMLIVIGDGLHNLLGGMAVAGAFLVDFRLAATTWLAAAAHEIPQELGEYGVLLHGGWSRRKAVFVNILSSLLFLVGGVLIYALSFQIDVAFLVPFAAGNFLYVGASDLVPEVNRNHRLATGLLHFLSFATGVLLLLGIRLAFQGWGATV